MKRLQSNAIVHLAVMLWRSAAGFRRWVVLYALLAGAAVLVALAAPLVMAQVIQAVQTLSGAALVERTEWCLLVYVSLGVLFWMLHGPSRVIETTIAFRVKRVLQTELFRKVTALPLSWQRLHHSGETIDQIAKASQALGDFAEGGFEVIHLLTRFLGSVVMLTWLMPQAGFAVTVAGMLAIVIIVLFDRRLIRQYAAMNSSFNEVAAAIQDYLTNVVTIISLRLERRVAREVQERTDAIMPLWRKNSITNELKWFTTSRMVDLTHAGVLLGFIIVTVKSGQPLELAKVYILSEYLRSIGDSFFQFTGKYGDLVVKSTRLHAIDHIEESFDRDVHSLEQAGLPANWRKIEIQDLTFRHETTAVGAVSGSIRCANLSLERGKSYALVGESGSGKSTLLKLLRGLLTPQFSQVYCDGAMLPQGLRHVAQHTTLIPQDPEIFADTIAFNVTLGVSGAAGELKRELGKALRLARFEQVLGRLPQGLETDIAEKGVNLSGGEKQRLAVARGLFFVRESGSEIVLLDEPTSSVDIFNERLIYEGVLREFQDYCVISAIHKLNLLPLFDEVLVFAEGRLVERGAAADLREGKGEFHRLWQTFNNLDAAEVSGS